MTDMMESLTTALADRYRIEREIGRGGMATVYLAEDLKHRRQVAVKVLDPNLAVAIGAARFLREIEIAAQLTHPHILPLHDSGEAGGFLYYVMPFIEGETLRGRIHREKQLAIDDALQITREVADGLAHAHSLGVIHRDIKPENILLTSGHAVIADFGIARAITEAGGERLTETGLSVGTPAYMSPEQAMGEQDVDARSDIYSLGCVAYELLAGDPPFAGTNPQAILARKTLESPPPLRTARDTVPPSVEHPILKALAKVPADRFATAGQFRDALVFTPASGTVVVPQQEQTSQEQPRLAHEKRPRLMGLAATLVFVVAIASWWIAQSAPGNGGVESLVVLPFYNATGDPEQDFLAAGMHDELINTLKHIGGLRVTSLTSAMRYKDSDKTIPEIARELGVDAVVEASVRRAGSNVNLEVQLIDAVPEEQELWSQPFDRSMDSVLVLYDDVARAIAREARVELTAAQQAYLGSARNVNQDSYEAYLRGMHLIRKGTLEDTQQGLAFLFQAIENDPADPHAYAALAMGYIVAAHGPDPPQDALQRARGAAERALSLDSTLAETLTALAFLKGYYEYQWEESEQMFLHALEMKPSMDLAHYWRAWQLAVLGRMDEAFEEHRIAKVLDPLNPLHTAGLGWLHLFVEEWEEVEAEARLALEMNPQDGMGLYVLAESQAARGMHEEALSTAERTLPVDRAWILGRQLAMAGRTEEARAIAEEWEAMGPDPWRAFSLGVLYTALGDYDDAFRWLNYEHIHCWVIGVRILRCFEPLWDDPRMADLMEKLNQPMPRAVGGF